MVEGCPVTDKEHNLAKYVGSAANGLGYYNVEVPQNDEQPKLDFTKCGKLYFEIGEISNEELQLELATSFNPNWPW
jgi:hypothetical protein